MTTASASGATLEFDATGRPRHAAAFRTRRILNWFPLGLTYAFLYMGRYNLTVAKVALGSLMTKEDFGIIFAAGTFTYAFAFVLNGPLTDRMGGRRAILIAAAGSALMNLCMGIYTQHLLTAATPTADVMVPLMSVLYAANMYFQSFAAVAVIKVNAHWFHVRERGGFGGIFGTMISSGIFFAFTLNGWILDFVGKDVPAGQPAAVWWVFLAPAAVIATMFVVEFILLRDRPGLAGHHDFETGDSNVTDQGNVSVVEVMKKVLTHPVIFTVALIEFCTGVLRNGVMQWFPVYAKEVWALPSRHPLVNGDVAVEGLVVGLVVVAAGLGMAGSNPRWRGPGLAFATLGLVPFVPAGWGGFLFAAGVLGSNVAGWVSDLVFQSRRGPAAGLLYGMLAVCAAGMYFALGTTTTEVAWVKDKKGPLQPGDVITSVAGNTSVKDWSDVSRAFACVRSECAEPARWDAARCLCTSKPQVEDPSLPLTTGTIEVVVARAGAPTTLSLPDPMKKGRAGDKRTLAAGPVLPMNPYWLGVLVFILSICVIGTHGLLSGTASMDFGGRRAAATAAGLIDGFVYLGTGLQSLSLGYLTSRSWSAWPAFLLPFAVIGFLLCLRIWNARAGKGGGH